MFKGLFQRFVSKKYNTDESTEIETLLNNGNLKEL